MEMIPLMDCMFLILVSFIYAFLGMTQNRGIPVMLPKATVQAVSEDETTHTITVEKDGTVWLDKQACEIDRLGAAILPSYKPGETTILLQGDTAAMHGRIVEVLDHLRRSGIHKVSVQTVLPENS